MKLTVRRYIVILSFQVFLLFLDLCINTFSVFVRMYNAVMLILFIVQDVCLILALAVLLLTFFSTYVFQAGLIEILYDRFRVTIMMCIFYFILTTILHIWTLSVRWKNPLQHNWSAGLHTFYVLQRFAAPFYYYFYKRAALRISDPRFYEDIEWVQAAPVNCYAITDNKKLELEPASSNSNPDLVSLNKQFEEIVAQTIDFQRLVLQSLKIISNQLKDNSQSIDMALNTQIKGQEVPTEQETPEKFLLFPIDNIAKEFLKKGGDSVKELTRVIIKELIDDCSRMDGWTVVVITYNCKARVSEMYPVHPLGQSNKGAMMSLGGVLEGILINFGRKLGRSFRVWESGDYHLILTTPLAPIL
ncbi:hypothetical protein RN001_005310 [Aquatica leii]|uniref:Transmembrane protein 138 n=1 Tax=Aquatica leii TaxID=1421715 RepID=A0AAN7PJN9_9COLE|nr:hypothetical protein RN001_005310 [Aquatica leii]